MARARSRCQHFINSYIPLRLATALRVEPGFGGAEKISTKQPKVADHFPTCFAKAF